MIIKSKSKIQNVERNRTFFFLILLFTIIIIYFSFNNSSLTIRPFIPFNSKMILYLFDIKLYLYIILIIYNFGNIYQTLILFYILLIPQYIYIILSTINLNLNQDIFYQFFLLMFFSFVLGHIAFTKENKIYYKKITIFYIIILLILLILLANYLAIENDSFILGNKIISGFVLAFCCYYFIFYVININQNDDVQLLNFIEGITNNILVVLLFILIISSIYSKDNDKYLTYILFALCLIIPLCGIKYEFKIIFNSNKRNWRDFNFSLDEENNIDNNNNNININNLLSKIKITKAIKWNKTKFFFDLLRLIFFLFIIILISFLSNFEDNNLTTAFLFFAFSIFLFILSKILMYWMEIINMTFFFLESDSLNYD